MTQNKLFIIFDLDDTLYKEIDYLQSAYKEIASFIETKISITFVYERMMELYYSQKDVFSTMESFTNHLISKKELLSYYRNHKPVISLNKDTQETLTRLSKIGLIAIITDGRSITQRNKIKALGLERWLKDDFILISEEFGTEKPCDKNYLYFQNKYPEYKFVYIGDNLKKDFITPNKLGWTTICLLDDGRNIHPQDFTCEVSFLPQYKVKSIKDILKILQL